MAARCFQQAIDADDALAIAHWGLAYSSGIYYNKPWARMEQRERREKLAICYDTARAARDRIGNADPAEAMLIEAVQARYPSREPASEADYHRWDDDYADAMRRVYDVFPEDDDVCALHAEALMTRTPWALWDLRSGEPSEGASTLEAIDVLEKAMQRVEDSGDKGHPGMLHTPFSTRAFRSR